MAQKGWLLIRKINNRNIHYAVTPAGLEELTLRSYGFLKRTVRNVVVYKEILETYLRETQKNGFSGIVLAGRSDFDFMLAHLCQKLGMRFMQAESLLHQEGSILVFSEDFQYAAQKNNRSADQRRISLRDILTGF